MPDRSLTSRREARENRHLVRGRHVRLLSSVVPLVCFSVVGCWLTSSFDDLRSAAPNDASSIDVSEIDSGDDASVGCQASSYVASVLADSPVAYYRLDETSGTIAKDSSGANNAQYRGGITLGVPGVLDDDTAASFDGTTAYVAGGSSPAFTNQSPFTLEAWIEPLKIDGAFRGVVSNETTSVSDRGGYTMWVQAEDAGSNNSGFERWADGKSNQAVASSILVGVWTHLVATFDGSRLSIFVNGVMVAQTDATPVSIASGFKFVIGALNGGATAPFFDGAIDEVALYDHVVSTTCIAAHYRLATAK